MELETLPGKLAIIGGGYIGLEFASYYRNFGSDVVVLRTAIYFCRGRMLRSLQPSWRTWKHAAFQVLRGIQVQRIRDREDGADLTVRTEYGRENSAAMRYWLPRADVPIFRNFIREAAGIELTAYGAVKTDEHLRTNVPHIWAMGDVAGGLQFTYISLTTAGL